MPQHPNPPIFGTAKQIEAHFGWPTATFLQDARLGRVRDPGPPRHPIGGRVLYAFADVQAWIESHAVRPGAARASLDATALVDHLVDRLRGGWGDGEMSHDIGATFRALDGLVGGRAIDIVVGIVNSHPFGTVLPEHAVSTRSDGRIEGACARAGGGNVTFAYNPADGAWTSSESCSWQCGIAGLAAHLISVRTGRPWGPIEALKAICSLIGQDIVLSAVGRQPTSSEGSAA